MALWEGYSWLVREKRKWSKWEADSVLLVFLSASAEVLLSYSWTFQRFLRCLCLFLLASYKHRDAGYYGWLIEERLLFHYEIDLLVNAGQCFFSVLFVQIFWRLLITAQQATTGFTPIAMAMWRWPAAVGSTTASISDHLHLHVFCTSQFYLDFRNNLVLKDE